VSKNSSKNKDIFKGKSVLSIDYGTKNVGFCLFSIGLDPFPLPFDQISNRGDEDVIGYIENLIRDEFIEVVVLGLPKHKDGKDSQMTKIIRNFHQALTKRIHDTPCFFQDEALSSFEAEDRMKNSPQYNFKIDKSRLDALAASIILEEWLDSPYQSTSLTT
jgi:putative holliday junction resolvase